MVRQVSKSPGRPQRQAAGLAKERIREDAEERARAAAAVRRDQQAKVRFAGFVTSELPAPLGTAAHADQHFMGAQNRAARDGAPKGGDQPPASPGSQVCCTHELVLPPAQGSTCAHAWLVTF